jgi:hypothetical protein
MEELEKSSSTFKLQVILKYKKINIINGYKNKDYKINYYYCFLLFGAVQNIC